MSANTADTKHIADNRHPSLRRLDAVFSRARQREQERHQTIAIVTNVILKAPLAAHQKGALIEQMVDDLRRDRKRRILRVELTDAKRALGEELSEANLRWVKDVERELALLDDGTPHQ
jgi:hypothetical protein